jgi:hypothetical protein
MFLPIYVITRIRASSVGIETGYGLDDLDTSLVRLVSFTSRPLYPCGKSPRYTYYRGLGGRHDRCGRRGEDKNHTPTRIQTPTPSTVQSTGSRYTDCPLPASTKNPNFYKRKIEHKKNNRMYRKQSKVYKLCPTQSPPLHFSL